MRLRDVKAVTPEVKGQLPLLTYLTLGANKRFEADLRVLVTDFAPICELYLGVTTLLMLHTDGRERTDGAIAAALGNLIRATLMEPGMVAWVLEEDDLSAIYAPCGMDRQSVTGVLTVCTAYPLLGAWIKDLLTNLLNLSIEAREGGASWGEGAADGGMVRMIEAAEAHLKANSLPRAAWRAL